MALTTTRPEAATSRRSVAHRLRVAAIDRLTDDAVAITLDVPAELADAYDFGPGQHVNLALPDQPETRRSFSVCTPAGSGVVRVAVKRIPDGAFSGHALDVLAPGDDLDVMTPAGRFTLTPDPARTAHYAMIAAGSGITPIMSIVATVLRDEPGSRVSLVYGNRSSSTTMFLDELAGLKDRYPERLHLVHVLSREPQDSELLSGRLDEERLARLLRLLVPVDTVDEWFLCGPYDLVVAARTLLLDLGADPARLHSELFHVGDAPPPRPVDEVAPAPVCEVSAVLDGRRSAVRLDDPDESVLEAVLRVRNDAPFACRGGVCGTCRARVLSGAVTMERRFALEDDEIAAGYVLTCQSHPTTPELTVDYDG